MKDYRSYLEAIAAKRDHLIRDPEYLRIFQQTELARRKPGQRNSKG
jgi:hypothetical protein